MHYTIRKHDNPALTTAIWAAFNDAYGSNARNMARAVREATAAPLDARYADRSAAIAAVRIASADDAEAAYTLTEPDGTVRAYVGGALRVILGPNTVRGAR